MKKNIAELTKKLTNEQLKIVLNSAKKELNNTNKRTKGKRNSSI
ncbi:hypothetical protein [Clostridium tyrobutyricum]|jgi:hypothetical protein|nr:hypothetical protein [Clostridium tyrobutyricum]